MAIQYTNIFRCKTLQNLPSLGYLVLKYAMWQPCVPMSGPGGTFKPDFKVKLHNKVFTMHECERERGRNLDN
jgi:hypothetical protein